MPPATASAAGSGWRQQLRREMLARRMALPPAVHAAASARITARLLADFPLLAQGITGFCWPIRQEPDVRPALHHWISQGGRAVLPVVVAAHAPLAFREWRPEQVLPLDRYGIPSPDQGEFLHPQALLLPLNAFDAAGYRIGYGGGYFDRTLAALQPRPLTIGVGFECCRVARIRPEAHDEPVDWLVTEAGTFRAGGQAA